MFEFYGIIAKLVFGYNCSIFIASCLALYSSETIFCIICYFDGFKSFGCVAFSGDFSPFIGEVASPYIDSPNIEAIFYFRILIDLAIYYWYLKLVGLQLFINFIIYYAILMLFTCIRTNLILNPKSIMRLISFKVKFI